MLSFCRVASSLAILIVCWTSSAAAQTVAREGDHFTYHKLPRFPIFVTYFDGRLNDSWLRAGSQIVTA
jgi:hypothetical protein